MSSKLQGGNSYHKENERGKSHLKLSQIKNKQTNKQLLRDFTSISKKKKILVTGAGNLKSSHLTETT